MRSTAHYISWPHGATCFALQIKTIGYALCSSAAWVDYAASCCSGLVLYSGRLKALVSHAQDYEEVSLLGTSRLFVVLTQAYPFLRFPGGAGPLAFLWIISNIYQAVCLSITGLYSLVRFSGQARLKTTLSNGWGIDL